MKQTREQQNDSTPLYRATVNFRSINSCTKSTKTVALLSIQMIENNFSNSFISTVDICNKFPSIKLSPSSHKYFNFYFQDKILTHARLPQGWCSFVFFATKATKLTFDQSTLQNFIRSKQLKKKDFPHSTYDSFISTFVNDVAIYSSKAYKNPINLHLLCIEAVLYALKSHGWLIQIHLLNPNLHISWIKFEYR